MLAAGAVTVTQVADVWMAKILVGNGKVTVTSTAEVIVDVKVAVNVISLPGAMVDTKVLVYTTLEGCGEMTVLTALTDGVVEGVEPADEDGVCVTDVEEGIGKMPPVPVPVPVPI